MADYIFNSSVSNNNLPSSFKVGDTIQFNYTGDIQQFDVLNATKLKLEVCGGQGGSSSANGYPIGLGGNGGYVYGDYTILQNRELNIFVGGAGGSVVGNNITTGGVGGYNGGGNGGNVSTGEMLPSGGGGGATDIRVGGIDLSNRIIVAGGGGGGCVHPGYGGFNGGVGGYPSGGNGDGTYGSGQYGYGCGGTQIAGGAGGTGYNSIYGNNGSLGLGANGPTCTKSSYPSGGGGGGGYYGGGSGSTNNYYGAGGGGSSYYGTLTNIGTTSGVQSGNGVAKITILELIPFMIMIDGALKNACKEWVKIDGVLRQVDTIKSRINGVLKN